MKVLFTGATGVVGRAAVPLLVARGDSVIALARSEQDRAWLDEIGSQPVSIDLLEAEEVRSVMDGVDVVIHFATSIPPQSRWGKREAWTMNDRLRSVATGVLVDAALAEGVERLIQQSITFVYADGGARWIDEWAPVEPAWEVLDSALDAEAHVARFREGGGIGVSLRLSRLYGPGRASSETVAAVTAGKIPVIGDGSNYVSSIHVEDAASALAHALEVDNGTYNVSDDEPVPSAVYLDTLAAALGAPRPRRVPRWLARLRTGRAVARSLISHRISNTRFKGASRWSPRHRSVREGWAEVVQASNGAENRF